MKLTTGTICAAAEEPVTDLLGETARRLAVAVEAVTEVQE